jgi:hypothetical protein
LQPNISTAAGLSCRPRLPLCRCRDGDVYIGSNWNELSILYLIFLATLAGLGIFAWLSYGTLWATGMYY